MLEPLVATRKLEATLHVCKQEHSSSFYVDAFNFCHHNLELFKYDGRLHSCNTGGKLSLDNDLGIFKLFEFPFIRLCKRFNKPVNLQSIPIRYFLTRRIINFKPHFDR